MRRRKVNVIIAIAVCILLVYGYRGYIANYSDEGILQRVTDRKGYSLDIVTERVPIEIFVKPEWIAFGADERLDMNAKVLQMNQTHLYLESVINRGNDIYFNFHAAFKMNRNNGEFLYNGIFNEDGTFNSPMMFNEIELFDVNRTKFNAGQIGTGPDADFSFGIGPDHYPLIQEGFYVKYTGYNLYRYFKKS